MRQSGCFAKSSLELDSAAGILLSLSLRWARSKKGVLSLVLKDARTIIEDDRHEGWDYSPGFDGEEFQYRSIDSVPTPEAFINLETVILKDIILPKG